MITLAFQNEQSMDIEIQFELDGDLEALTLSSLFVLVEGMAASLNQQAKTLAWLQDSIIELAAHLYCYYDLAARS